MTDLDSADLLPVGVGRYGGAEPRKTRQPVNPQADVDGMLIYQLSGQAPAGADIAIVIHDRTEDVPAPPCSE